MRRKVALGELCNPSLGQVKEQPNTVIDYIDISSVDNESKSVIGFQTMAFSEAPSRARKDIKKNNILVSTVRPNLNAVAVYEHETPNKAVVSTGFCVLDCKENVDYRFVYNFCRSKTFIEDMVSQATGASYPAVSDKIVRTSLVPEYSYEEQCEISHILDSVSSIVESRKKELQKLDDLIKSRFVEMFGDYDLSHTQNNWKPIADIGKVVGGATPKTNIEEYWGGKYRWITPAELDSDSGYIYDSVRKLTKAGVDSCSLQEMPIDTVILSSRAPIGKVAIAGKNFYCNQGFKNIICDDEILPRYLYTILLLNTEYLNSLGRGATFKEISKSIVENIMIPVPPIDLQKKFIDFVNQVDKLKFNIQNTILFMGKEG